MNTAEFFFDFGDCCLESDYYSKLQCEMRGSYQTQEQYLTNYNSFQYVAVDCPENVCIESNIYCIPEQVGDGICQDHNNGPFCDYDSGDCCSIVIDPNYELINYANISQCNLCHCQYNEYFGYYIGYF